MRRAKLKVDSWQLPLTVTLWLGLAATPAFAQTMDASAVRASWVPDTPAHSWQAVAAGGMSIGVKGMMVAPGFKYTTRLADRKPALDYRK